MINANILFVVQGELAPPPLERLLAKFCIRATPSICRTISTLAASIRADHDVVVICAGENVPFLREATRIVRSAFDTPILGIYAPTVVPDYVFAYCNNVDDLVESIDIHRLSYSISRALKARGTPAYAPPAMTVEQR